MKIQFTIHLGTVLAASMACVNADTAGMNCFTVDAGGGTCAAAPYLLGGTIGQPDASSASGGSYTLVGGFWGGAYAGPMPQPSIAKVNGKVQITWPSWATGFKLLGKPDLSPGTLWTLAPFVPVLEGDHYLVEIPPGEARGFYQLWLP